MDQSTPPNPSPDNQPQPTPPSTQPTTGSRPSGPAASGERADRLTVLAHELGNLLDGSLRSLNLARRSLPGESSEAHNATTDEGRKRLDIVQQSLLRMAEIVNAAMRQPGVLGAASVAAPDASIELGEAIFHAVDVLMPTATEQGVRISTVVSNGLSGVPAGTLYSVIINALTNAIEAVAAAIDTSAGETGTVEVFASWTDDGRIQIRIQDDGGGLPDVSASELVRFGYSTKARGSGLGLAVARAIVSELPDGTMRLCTRTDRADPKRPGTVFEVAYRPGKTDDVQNAAGAA